jgi:hypothetical protein
MRPGAYLLPDQSDPQPIGERPMSRMEYIDIKSASRTGVSADFAEDADIQLFLKLGRMAFFFCIWSAMVLPVALIYSVRF